MLAEADGDPDGNEAMTRSHYRSQSVTDPGLAPVLFPGAFVPGPI